jgi:NodT family efflux transporter outer membrane factor (OMF) lipoprotein
LPEGWSRAPADGGAALQTTTGWWRGFDDPVMVQLIEEAALASPTVRLAQLRLIEARAQARTTIAAYLPRLSATIGAQYTRVEDGPLLTGSFQQFVQSGGQVALTQEEEQMIGTYGPRVAWEIPLFARAEAAARGARASRAFAAADLAAAQVAIAGDVAEAYVALRRAQALADAVAQSVAAAESLADVLEISAGAGISAPADAADARRQAQTLRAQQADLGLAVIQARNQLAVLRGVAPGTSGDEVEQALQARAPVPSTPLFTLAVAPADLLRMRPDVAQAEAQALVAAAALGAARSDLLPQINLTGGLNIADNLIGSGAPERLAQFEAQPLIAIPLFDWGQRMAGVDRADAQFEAALIGYRQAVVLAVAEADGALAALSFAQDRLVAAQAAETAAVTAARGARAAFDAGLSNLPDRLRAEQLLIDAQVSRIEAQAAMALAAIAVYRAFGGGPPETTSP